MARQPNINHTMVSVVVLALVIGACSVALAYVIASLSNGASADRA